MARTKSAIKAIRTSEKKRLRGKSVRTATKTYVAKARETIENKEVEAAREAVATAISQLDSAAQKGVLHQNNAARRKSRLMKKFNALQGGEQSAAGPTKAKK